MIRFGMLAISLFMAGCFGSSAPTRLYSLSPASVSSSAPEHAALRIGVGPVRIADYLSRSGLVLRSSAHAVDVLDFEQWVEPLDAAFTRELARTLELRLADRAALVVPSTLAGHAEYAIPLQLERFEVVEGNGATLVALWMVKGRDGSDVLPWQRTVLTVPIEGETIEDKVEGLATLVSRLADTISTGLSPKLAPKA